MKRIGLTILLGAAIPACLAAQQGSSSCSAHHSGSHHAGSRQEGVDERGDSVMGFDHTKTIHHFVLTASGGIIEVSANDKDDVTSRDAIRGHLAHIAKMFADGNFDAPMLIHDRVPPGVPEMKRDPKSIRWTYEDTPAGGNVVAVTKNPAELEALHAFLRFQIEDHRTGDSTEVSTP
jgi:hypothetical protein